VIIEGSYFFPAEPDSITQILKAAFQETRHTFKSKKGASTLK